MGLTNENQDQRDGGCEGSGSEKVGAAKMKVDGSKTVVLKGRGPRRERRARREWRRARREWREWRRARREWRRARRERREWRRARRERREWRRESRREYEGQKEQAGGNEQIVTLPTLPDLLGCTPRLVDYLLVPHLKK
eukprot:767317-Hanusia_phi.AAC.3